MSIVIYSPRPVIVRIIHTKRQTIAQIIIIEGNELAKVSITAIGYLIIDTIRPNPVTI